MIQTRHPQFKAYLALAFICFIWGTSWIASKQAVRDMPALQMAGIRQIWAGMMYLIFFLAKGYALPRGRQWLPILFLAVINFVLSNGLSTWGVKYISAGLGAIIGASFPLWLIILSLIRYNERGSWLTWVGLILGFGGICIVFYDYLTDLLVPEFRFGIVISVIAALSWTVGTIYTKEHALQFNAYFAIGLQMLISGFVLTGYSWGTGDVIPIGSITLYTWLNITYLVILSSVLAFIAYLYALQNLPTSLVSIYAYINPVVAVLIGGLFFGEKLNAVILSGAGVTLLGVYFVNAALRQRKLFFRPPRGRI